MLPSPHRASLLLRTLMQVNRLVRSIAYRSRRSTRLLFDANLAPCGSTSYWELGTLAMQRALVPKLRHGLRVAEVGTGPYAVLALWALSRHDVELVATEIRPEWVAWARRMAMANGRRLDIRCTDVLEGCEGPFDLIWFVPPFHSEATFRIEVAQMGELNDLEVERLRSRSCGGTGGWEIVERFYEQAALRLRPGGEALVCMGTAHHTSGYIRSLSSRHGLVVTAELRLGILPYAVFVAQRPRALS